MGFVNIRSVETRLLLPDVAFPQEVIIAEATADQAGLTVGQYRREHITVTPEFLAASGLTRRQQIRVEIPGYGMKVMTIMLYHAEEDSSICRMDAEAYLEFEIAVPLTVVGTMSSPTVTPRNELTLAEAEALGEGVEFLVAGGTDVICLAQHGGDIEVYTDDQAIRCRDTLVGLGRAVTVWGVRGYGLGAQSAADRWHVTSVDWVPWTWPILNTIWGTAYTWATSFHGMLGTKTVAIGGLAPLAVLNDAAAAVAAVLPGDYTVSVTSAEHMDGDSPRNIMNRFGGTNTIQLEQTFDVRNGYANAVADAIATVIDAQLP